MIQEYIVWAILIGIVGYLLYKGLFQSGKSNQGKCSGCCGCSAKDEIDSALKERLRS